MITMQLGAQLDENTADILLKHDDFHIDLLTISMIGRNAWNGTGEQ